MKLSVDFKTAKLVRQGLENTSAELPKVGRWRIYVHLKKAISTVFKRYAPERPNQKYRRTFKFRNSWKLYRHKDTGYTVENTASRKGKKYPHWVVGDAYGNKQAKVHAGRWWIFRDEMEGVLNELPADVTKHIHMIARRQPNFKAGGAG